MLFIGTHERTVDSSGGVVIPAPFATWLGDGVYLTYGADACIDLHPTEVFETMLAQLKEREHSETHPPYEAVLAASTFVRLSARHRIGLPARLRTHADIRPRHRAKISGSFQRIEIWSAERARATLGDPSAATTSSSRANAAVVQRVGESDTATVEALRALEVHLQRLYNLLQDEPVAPDALDELRRRLTSIEHEVRSGRPSKVALRLLLSAIGAVILNLVASALWQEWGNDILEFVRVHLQ